MEKLQEKCPICLRRIHDKTVIDCGHSFCGPCIMIYWVQQKNMTCPQCTGMIPHRHQKSHLEFTNFTELLKILLAEKERAPPEEIVACASHQKPLTFFCQEDMALICDTCRLSFEHREHPALSIDEAAYRFKVGGWILQVPLSGCDTSEYCTFVSKMKQTKETYLFFFS